MNEPVPHRQFEVLITAAEAYPRLEQEFLRAENEIVAGFRIFDPWTKLRSEEAKALGSTWFDLIVHTLNRGVTINMTLTDFDPVVRMTTHVYAWKCLRAFLAAGEASKHPENLKARAAMHPARVGKLPRAALWARSVKEINAQLQTLKEDEGLSGDALLKVAPKLRDLVVRDGETLKARKFPPPALVPVTHHQKLAVFDGARLYVGGLDTNDRRYDTPEHERAGEETWHDVQILVDGEVAKEARTHLLTMDKGLMGGAMPQPKRLLRTLSAKRRIQAPRMSPRVMLREIAEAHHAAIKSSEDFIYFETQFFRDEDLARALADRAREATSLSLVMILPAAPEDIAFSSDWGPDAAFGEHLQAKCLDILLDGFGDRAFVGSPVQPRTLKTDDRDSHYDAPLVYLHAKVSLFDDHTGIVSSANLNGRSLNWDTEVGVPTETREEVRLLKQRCFTHWLGEDADQAFYDGAYAVEAWADRARTNARLVPEKRKGFIVPYRISKGKDDAQALPGVPAEMA